MQSSFLAGLLLASMLSGPRDAFAAAEVPVLRFTDDEVPDWAPQVAGDRIVWLRGSRDVYLFDGDAVVQVTDDAALHVAKLSSALVAISSCEVYDDVFYCYEPRKLSVYDGEALFSLSNPATDVSGFDVDGSNVAWVASGEVFLWDGGDPQQLTHQYSEGLPLVWDQLALSGDTVAWAVGGAIFRHRGGETVPILDDAYPGAGDINYLDVSEGRMVWADTVGGDSEIFLFDGEEVVQLTDDDVNEFFPEISDSRVVWEVIDGEGDAEIHLFDGKKSAPLTNNDFHDEFPQISGTNVVWVGRPEGIGDPGEIYWYDGVAIHRVTENDYQDAIPSISGSRLAWYGCPDHDEVKGCTLPVRPYGTILPHAEIFLAPEPGVGLQALVASACIAGLAAWRPGRNARRVAHVPGGARS